MLLLAAMAEMPLLANHIFLCRSVTIKSVSIELCICMLNNDLNL
jgi:hypothetical protein